MSNKKKNGQNMLQWIIPTAILVVIILFTLTSYKTDIFSKEKSNKLDEYSGKAREIADYYSSEIYMIGQVARMLSTRVSVDHDYFCDDNVDLLTSAVSQLNIDAGYILRNDGKVMNHMGVEAPSLKAATNGDLNIESSSVDEYLVNSSGDCVHYVSASFAEGSVILKYTPKPLSDLELFLSSNAKISTYVLISSTGMILDSAGVESQVFKEGSDLFEYLDGASYNGVTKKNEFLKNLEQQLKGKALITNKDGVSKYFVYQPIGDYKTFVMIITDEYQVNQAAEKDISSTNEMFWKIVILILIFVAILVIISIINATRYRKANRELKEQAETDLLTDLYNKVATETKIKEYLANEGKNKKSIMFVLDIDNFKKINDTMGHAFGDEVLSTLGHQLKSEFRINDIIGRTGGDEFIILLKDLKDDAALSREANRVATFFKNFKVGEYTKYSATASIGVVEIPNDGTDFETLYKEADKALYLAKKRGKNQMAFYKDTKDIKIEKDEPVLKVVEETPKPEMIRPEPPRPGEASIASANAAAVASAKQVATLIDSTSESSETRKATEPENTEELQKTEEAKAVEEIKKPEKTGVSNEQAEPEKPKAEEQKPVIKKEPLPSVRDIFSAKEEIPDVKPVETQESKPSENKPVTAVQPQKKIVKKVVRKVVKKTVVKPSEEKPVQVKSQAPKSEAPKPAASKPAVPKPEEPKPAASKPAASKPAASKPVVPKPEVPKREEPKPAASKPEAPKITGSKKPEPETEQPEEKKEAVKSPEKFSFFS